MTGSPLSVWLLALQKSREWDFHGLPTKCGGDGQGAQGLAEGGKTKDEGSREGPYNTHTSSPSEIRWRG